MTPIEKLEKLAGGTRALADILGVDPSLVTRWKKPRSTVDGSRHAGNDGRLPPKYNRAIRAAVGIFDEQEEWFACLDPDVCPTCGQPIDEGRVL